MHAWMKKAEGVVGLSENCVIYILFLLFFLVLWVFSLDGAISV